MMNEKLLSDAATILRKARRTVAFTGAGISVESGIPPFRGPEGLWSHYDPTILAIDYFQAHPRESWRVIKEIFYDYFGRAQPNAAHVALARLEAAGYLHGVITQNIDNLHQEAGSEDVVEFHGTAQRLVCIHCGQPQQADDAVFAHMPPRCPACGGLLKPDFVFFGEGIPRLAYDRTRAEARLADVWLVVGTTGEIMPASLFPFEAKQQGATIIEVNIQPSNYTPHITDIFLRGKASHILSALAAQVLA